MSKLVAALLSVHLVVGAAHQALNLRKPRLCTRGTRLSARFSQPCMASQWFVKTETFKESLTFPTIKPHLEAHKEWVAGLRSGGMTVTSGYRVDAQGRPGGGGLMLFAAQDYEAAQGIVEQDPLVANSCVDWQLNRWIPEVGDIALVDGGEWYTKREP